MQGNANVILKNTINVNQERHKIDYADASLHVESCACMLMHVDCCEHVQMCNHRISVVQHWCFFRGFPRLLCFSRINKTLYACPQVTETYRKVCWQIYVLIFSYPEKRKFTRGNKHWVGENMKAEFTQLPEIILNAPIAPKVNFYVTPPPPPPPSAGLKKAMLYKLWKWPRRSRLLKGLQ